MTLPLVKICGITRVQDALAAATAGARALGLVFWPGSPRCVSLEVARAVAREVPPFVALVGVFVNERPRAMLDIAARVPLTAVQFHGDETDEIVEAFPWRCLRALSLEGPDAEARLARLSHRVTVLLDAHDPERRGGTGRTVDWTRAAAVAAQRRVVLGGGLTAENVGDAIRHVHPWAVDVSSGVETSPGSKDAHAIQAFMDAVHHST